MAEEKLARVNLSPAMLWSQGCCKGRSWNEQSLMSAPAQFLRARPDRGQRAVPPRLRGGRKARPIHRDSAHYVQTVGLRSFAGYLTGGRQFLRNRRSNRHMVPLYGISDGLFTQDLKVPWKLA